jgi:hypothetical protein
MEVVNAKNLKVLNYVEIVNSFTTILVITSAHSQRAQEGKVVHLLADVLICLHKLKI